MLNFSALLKGEAMSDLLTCDLNTISLQDVDEYLGLSQPENLRLSESSRIDYKEELPADLGDDVAALANTYGGLILIGIKADKKGNIPVQWNGVQLGPDPSARISARILSTVRPRPQFDIGLVEAANGKIVVLRVKEGDYPPYEYEQGNSVRISLRVNDVKRPAAVRDIEALMERRATTGTSPSSRLAALDINTLWTYSMDKLPGGDTRQHLNNRAHRIFLAPHRPLNIRLDLTFEKEFEHWIKVSFPDTESFSQKNRTGQFYEVRGSRPGRCNAQHRVWRISSNGSLGFVRNIDWHGSPGEPIGDVAVDLIFFFRLARRMLETSGNFGNATLTDQLCCGNTTFLSKFPEPTYLGDYDDVSGIQFPPVRPEVLPNMPNCEQNLGFHDFEQPDEQITSILFDQLRAGWGAGVHYEHLLDAVAALDRQSKAPKWGRI